MTEGLFVTGTGTGVGKTYVSTALLRGFSKIGRSTTYMKPVETGCDFSSDKKSLTGADTASALKFASCQVDMSLHTPYPFYRACSPHLAVRESGCEIRMANITLAYEKLKQTASANIIVVEGAGGIFVPINDNEYMIDVIKALAIKTVLVATPELGTLNLTFMSLRALEQYGIVVAGIVINNAKNINRDFIYDDNVKTIRKRTYPVPCIDINYCAQSPDIAEFCNELISGI